MIFQFDRTREGGKPGGKDQPRRLYHSHSAGQMCAALEPVPGTALRSDDLDKTKDHQSKKVYRQIARNMQSPSPEVHLSKERERKNRRSGKVSIK